MQAIRKISYAEALNEALHEEMRRDALVFVMGEDVGKMGGLFKVTQGLLEAFGPQRVIDTPISEAAIAGAGVGSALVGTRPVIEFQFNDFMTIAMDQIVNHAAKLRYMTNGMVSVPLVIRAPVCGGISLGAQHSQSLESWFVHTPGLKVVMPSTPADAKGLLKSAIRDDNPVLFFESEVMYALKGEVPTGEYVIPLGVADVKRPGRDVTLVTWSKMLHTSLKAAEQLAADGIEAEVVDVRTVRPLDAGAILASVRRTHRCVVVQEGWPFAGVGAEVVALVARDAFEDLDAPPERVTSLDVPMPYARNLEELVLPAPARVIATVRRVLGREETVGAPVPPARAQRRR